MFSSVIVASPCSRMSLNTVLHSFSSISVFLCSFEKMQTSRLSPASSTLIKRSNGSGFDSVSKRECYVVIKNIFSTLHLMISGNAENATNVKLSFV